MDTTLGALADQMAAQPPNSDAALDLLVAGWHHPSRPGCAAFEQQAARVLEAWIRSISWYFYQQRDNPDIDEARSQATDWLVTEVSRFRPRAGQTAGAYIRAGQQAARSAAHAAEQQLDPESFRVRSTGKNQREQLTQQLQREPTMDEIAAATRQQQRHQRRVNIAAKQPQLTDAALERAVDRRMSKDGVNSRLADLDQLLASGLPTSIEEHGWDGDRTRVELHAEMVLAPQEQRTETLWRIAFGDQQWARTPLECSLGLLDADTAGPQPPAPSTHQQLSRRQRNALIRHASVRLAAPHAQFSHAAALTLTGSR